jgi:hypothetical protein
LLEEKEKRKEKRERERERGGRGKGGREKEGKIYFGAHFVYFVLALFVAAKHYVKGRTTNPC